MTLFLDEARMEASTNDGFYKDGDRWGFRFKGQRGVAPLADVPAELQPIIVTFEETMPYYF